MAMISYSVEAGPADDRVNDVNQDDALGFWEGDIWKVVKCFSKKKNI